MPKIQYLQKTDLHSNPRYGAGKFEFFSRRVEERSGELFLTKSLFKEEQQAPESVVKSLNILNFVS